MFRDIKKKSIYKEEGKVEEAKVGMVLKTRLAVADDNKFYHRDTRRQQQSFYKY